MNVQNSNGFFFFLNEKIMQIVIVFNVYVVIHWNGILLADQMNWNESGPKNRIKFHLIRRKFIFLTHSVCVCLSHTARSSTCGNLTKQRKIVIQQIKRKRRAMTSKEPLHAKSDCVFEFDFSLWLWFHLCRSGTATLYTKWECVEHGRQMEYQK